MYNFKNDYNQGCHKKILERLAKENEIQFEAYGQDKVSEEAKKKIRKALNFENCDIHFFSGGTQTNLVTISSILKPYQGVICSAIGHINVHETAAIEATGHRIISIEDMNGKITGVQVEELIKEHYSDENFEHSVQPGMVYISNPTEVGTIYNKEELQSLHEVCKKNEIPLYMDGARLASAVTSKDGNIKLKDLCNLCDLFYIGGTKCGALFGECLVIVNDKYKKDFRYGMKQRGALLAKSFVLAIQFDELFTDDLYLELGKYENSLADKIRISLDGKIDFLQKQYTNQVFLILENSKIEQLRKKFKFIIWEKIDQEHSAIRICVSWGTSEESVEELIKEILY